MTADRDRPETALRPLHDSASSALRVQHDHAVTLAQALETLGRELSTGLIVRR